MKLFTYHQYKQLLENGKPENRDKDHPPVVHITLPGTKAEWLLSELDPENPTIAFGLCDLGMGFPEMGYVDLNELLRLKIGPFGFTIFNNPLFEGKYPLTIYWRASKVQCCITRDDKLLMQTFQSIKDKLKL
ncbi:MAG TPA: DUF2958 domain-containing protein [Candidatus Wunengus sp. YC63]|uniref:DUF2958 domain-containing protein n=1 Tax=Candidatus Wunengus sp. YC63 TaxID=3367699 RepID=UPI0040254310